MDSWTDWFLNRLAGYNGMIKRTWPRLQKIQSEWMKGWMDGWMDGWMVGWMEGWMVGWLESWMNRLAY